MRRFLAPLAALCLLAACPEPGPQPGPFVAGSATVRMSVPLGIGTAGYGFAGAPSNPSPYADLYPGTDRIHGHPTFTALALSRGEGFELILVRSDMIAVVQQLRDAVVAELLQRTGRDLDDALVIGATHTHAGPGRFIQGGLFHLIADHFVPAFYTGLVSSMADAVEQAIADQSPAELGVAIAQAPGGHSDRRCEDGVERTNDALGLLAVRKEGRVTALVLNYAIHGTVLDTEDFTLGKDVAGAIEEHVARTFDHPVDVMMFNAWGGDVAPSAAGTPPEVPLSPLPGGYDAMDEIGLYVASAVQEAMPALAWSAEPPLQARSYRYPIGHESIGYDWGEFDYDWGAVYCDTPDATCDEVLVHPDLVDGCIPFPEDSPAPSQSVLTVGQVGPAHFTTWGGECGTELAEQAMAAMRGHDGVEQVLFLGYADDYLGYQLTYDDWWHGGYEASGGMWGPRQGEYMARVQGEAFAHWIGDMEALPFEEPAPPPAFDLAGGVVWTWEDALDAGTVFAQPAASYPATGVATFAVRGSDPGLGAPVAVLQREVGAEWQDVDGDDGRSWDSDGQGFWVDLSVAPTYEETPGPVPRTFLWTFSMPLTTRGARFGEETLARFRFRAIVPLGGGDEAEVASEPFAIE